MSVAPTVKVTRKPRRKADIPENETPGQRFRRVAGLRVAKALAALETLEACFDVRSYEWSEEQAEKVMGALTKAGAAILKKSKERDVATVNQAKFDL